MEVDVRFTGNVLKEDVPSEVLVEMEETILGSESLLAEDVEVEAHFEDSEPLGDGGPESAEESAVHEVKVVDWVSGGVRLRCS